MQEVLRSHSLSQALSIKTALEIEGINAVLFDENALSYMHLAGQIRVMVPDADEDRARAVIHALEPVRPAQGPITRAWRWERRGLRLIAVAVGLSILRFMLADYITRFQSDALLVAGWAVGGLGALLFAIGLFFLEEKPPSPWADEGADERGRKA